MKIVRVTALWCMSCLSMKRTWKKVFSDIENLEINDLDFDEDHDLVKKLNIGKILPELIVYKNDIEIMRIIGEKTKKEMQRIISELNEKS
ncbi:thioredoxin family protein [Candidatus Izemoplasma sp. B36]|uniref:thioredoxin family protein n=1 Tax=Candidatus Izemoplasma sp. B36 TaxID=3242468 RepID=UPI003557CEF5